LPAQQAAVRGRPRPGPFPGPISVAVLAGDAVTGQGAAAYLDSCPDLKILTAARQHEADVVLIIVNWVADETITWMQRIAEAAKRLPRFVLVGDGVREHHVLRAVTYGPVSVIPRREAEFERIVGAITAIHEGRLEMPDDALGWLVDHVRTTHKDFLEPNGLTATGLEAREIEVLRLLAEGMGTPEIAQMLNYSERTVKNIIHRVLTRLRLRNRAHAVAYAVRNGSI
jgi:DNA-binding NarL/FixJ family response regulator